MLLSSVFIRVSRSTMLDAEKVTFVSLAYILGEPRFKLFGKSLTIDQKEYGGPIIDTWKTPQF